MRNGGPALSGSARQDFQPDAEPGDRQRRAGGHPDRPSTPTGTDPSVQPLPVLILKGGVCLGIAHHPREFVFKVFHDVSFHLTGSMASPRSCRNRVTPRDVRDRAVPTGHPSASATCTSDKSW